TCRVPAHVRLGAAGRRALSRTRARRQTCAGDHDGVYGGAGGGRVSGRRSRNARPDFLGDGAWADRAASRRQASAQARFCDRAPHRDEPSGARRASGQPARTEESVMSQQFPDSPWFKGNFAPISFEAEADNVMVRGDMPKELRGTLYRNGPNPQFAPRDANHHWFIGDGMIHAFHIEYGRVSYRNRWVRTPKWRMEHDAHRALFGSWGNPMTTDPSVAGKASGGVANTNIVWHGGKLLALEEAHLPVAVDPMTLATEGAWDFAGGLAGGKVTAHPKLDPETGEMIFFAYSAGGFFAKTMLYGVVDRNGKLTRLDKFDAPYSAIVHDFLVTPTDVLFPALPQAGTINCTLSR